MTVETQIKMFCSKQGITVSELARRCGMSPQAFSQKMKRGTFTPDELKNIAAACGCVYRTAFVCEDGYEVLY